MKYIKQFLSGILGKYKHRYESGTIPKAIVTTRGAEFSLQPIAANVNVVAKFEGPNGTITTPPRSDITGGSHSGFYEIACCAIGSKIINDAVALGGKIKSYRFTNTPTMAELTATIKIKHVSVRIHAGYYYHSIEIWSVTETGGYKLRKSDNIGDCGDTSCGSFLNKIKAEIAKPPPPFIPLKDRIVKSKNFEPREFIEETPYVNDPDDKKSGMYETSHLRNVEMVGVFKADENNKVKKDVYVPGTPVWLVLTTTTQRCPYDPTRITCPTIMTDGEHWHLVVRKSWGKEEEFRIIDADFHLNQRDKGLIAAELCRFMESADGC